jgi:hypothetical protein
MEQDFLPYSENVHVMVGNPPTLQNILLIILGQCTVLKMPITSSRFTVLQTFQFFFMVILK